MQATRFNLLSSQGKLGRSGLLIRSILLAVVTFNFVIGTWLICPVANAATSEITVYRDPNCSCCEGWIDRLQQQGFQTTEVQTAEIDQIKQQHQIPDDLTSCHTAILDQYVLEGHVPIADIQRLLAEQPAVQGITVPGMPVGTPGMEDGDRRDDFTVYSFGENGVEVFNQYQFN
jgi:hypothetical protein